MAIESELGAKFWFLGWKITIAHSFVRSTAAIAINFTRSGSMIPIHFRWLHTRSDSDPSPPLRLQSSSKRFFILSGGKCNKNRQGERAWDWLNAADFPADVARSQRFPPRAGKRTQYFYWTVRKCDSNSKLNSSFDSADSLSIDTWYKKRAQTFSQVSVGVKFVTIDQVGETGQRSKKIWQILLLSATKPQPFNWFPWVLF